MKNIILFVAIIISTGVSLNQAITSDTAPAREEMNCPWCAN